MKSGTPFLVRQERGKEAPGPCRALPVISLSAKPGGPVTRNACVASRPKFAALILGPRSQTRPLPGSRPSFRFQRNRAGRSHAGRVLLRAQNSLRSFRGPARKPGTFRSAKKHKFQRQQLANLCFSKRVTPMAPDPGLRPKSRASPGWPRHAPAGAERQTRWRFPCARETVRMTFARSGALRLPENGILKRVRPPARLRESISVRQTFRSGTCGKFPYGNLSDGTL